MNHVTYIELGTTSTNNPEITITAHIINNIVHYQLQIVHPFTCNKFLCVLLYVKLFELLQKTANFGVD